MAPTPKRLRILLVKPKPSLGPILGVLSFQLLEPIELGYLAAAVPREHEVKVLDLRLTRFEEREFARALRNFAPDLIGFTAYTHEASSTKRLARMATEKCPEATLVVGGPHATVAPEDYDLELFDAVVRGEGTQPFRAIVNSVANGDPIAATATVRVRGGAHLRACDDEWPTYPDPSILPVPRRDLWDPRPYRSVWLSEEIKPWGSIYPRVSLVRSSYGCKMKCTFCIVPHISRGEHMPRLSELVADEIASLPNDHVYFVDDENFIDPEHAASLADALERRGVRKRYFAWTRATTVNNHPQIFRRWREIGLDAVFIGFEFTTDRELKSVHKGGTAAGNEEAVAKLRAMGVAVHAGFLILPEWTEDDFSRLRTYVKSLPPMQCSFTVCSPSPGTPDYEAMRERIWIENPYDLYDCMHPLTPTSVPLKTFARLYAEQALEGIANVPLRAKRQPISPIDILRANLAGKRYGRGFREMYRDYPRELWS